VQPFELSPFSTTPQMIEPALEALQGWRTDGAPLTARPHPIQPLVELELMRGGTATGIFFPIRSGEATVGRYSPMTGPVDIDLGLLQDHERFRIGLPHLRLVLRDGRWRAEPMTWAYSTYVEGEPLRSDGARLEDGNLLSLGNVLFRVHLRGGEVTEPLHEEHEVAWLRMKFDAAASNTVVPLTQSSMVVGRHCPEVGHVDIDLQGLDDAVRVHVARHHARFFQLKGRWHVENLGSKGPVFINRNPPIREAQALVDGDEVALGNAIFVFEDASARTASEDVTPSEDQAPVDANGEGGETP